MKNIKKQPHFIYCLRYVVTAVAVMALRVRRSTQLTGTAKFAHALTRTH